MKQRILGRTAWSCLLTTTLLACGETGGGTTTTADTGVGTGGNGGNGGTPAGGSGGMPMGGTGGEVGGNGGTPVGGTPVGGTGGIGGTPVGGTGGTGGAPVGGNEPDAAVVTPDAAVATPDAAVVTPDAAIVTPDAAVVTPDAAVVTPDAAVVTPDAAVVTPDAAVVTPDAAVLDPDAAVLDPDAAPVPVYACGNLPVEDLLPAATAVDADHWTLVGSLADGGSEIAGVCGGGGPEKVYGLTIPADGVWRFDTFGAETDFDTVLYLMSSCPTQPDGGNLRCSDDVGSLASGLLHEFRAGDVVYVVVDGYDPGGGNFRLNVGRLPVIAEHAVCDAYSQTNACADGLYCFALNVPGQPLAEEGTCASSVDPPVINNVSAFRTAADALAIEVDGSDAVGDVQSTYLLELLAGNRAQVLDPQTGTTEASVTFYENLLGQQNFVGSSRLSVFGNWPNTTAVRIRVVDTAGNVSESRTTQISPQPVVNANQPCDIRGVLNTCAAGSACLDPDGPDSAGRPTCGAPTAPTLTSATATYNEATRSLAITYRGRDPDHDVVGFVTGFYNAQNALIDPPGAEVFPFDDITWNGDDYTGHTRLRLGIEAATFVALATYVYDRAEETSGQVGIDQFGAPAAVGRGATCDLYGGARDVCSAGNLCYSELFGSADGTCQAPVAVCPDYWDVADLNDAQVGAEWRASGSLADAMNRTIASCASMSAQDIFTFTAPQAGTFRFRTESDEPGADTALFLRSFCRYSDYGAELACNDDVSPQNFLSDVSLDLQANETIYVFVGGVNTAAAAKGSWRGRYRLIAARR